MQDQDQDHRLTLEIKTMIIQNGFEMFQDQDQDLEITSLLQTND